MEERIPELPRVPTLVQPHLHITFLTLQVMNTDPCKLPPSDPSPLMKRVGKNLGHSSAKGSKFKAVLLNFAQLLIAERFYLEFKYLPGVQLNSLWKGLSHTQLK